MNAASPRRETEYMLGRIEAGLDIIKQTLSEDRLSSAQYRTEVRKELKENAERMAHFENKLSEARADIAEMKPKLDALDQQRHERSGAIKFAGILGKVAHVVSAAIGAAIVFVLERWIGK